jgi:dUTP pyrophosphatase
MREETTDVTDSDLERSSDRSGDEPELRVRRLDPDVPMPSYAHEGDAGLDLAAAADLILEPGERAAVPTGLAVAIPDGWVGLVHPRSGLARRHGVTVTNAPGTIDAGYRGEVQVLLINLGHDPVTLRRGDRIAQLLLQEVGRARVIEVVELDDTSRGDGGFGSTGIGEPVAPGARGLPPHG